jgi:hypothetical protein
VNLPGQRRRTGFLQEQPTGALPMDAQLAGLRQRQQVGASIADRAEQATVFCREWVRRQPLGGKIAASQGGPCEGAVPKLK